MKAKGSSRDHPESVVEALDASIGVSGADVAQDAFEVCSHGAPELDEGLELGALCPGEPVLKEGPSLLDVVHVEDLGEPLLQLVGATDSLVGLPDTLQLGSAPVGQSAGGCG